VGSASSPPQPVRALTRPVPPSRPRRAAPAAADAAERTAVARPHLAAGQQPHALPAAGTGEAGQWLAWSRGRRLLCAALVYATQARVAKRAPTPRYTLFQALGLTTGASCATPPHPTPPHPTPPHPAPIHQQVMAILGVVQGGIEAMLVGFGALQPGHWLSAIRGSWPAEATACVPPLQPGPACPPSPEAAHGGGGWQRRRAPPGRRRGALPCKHATARAGPLCPRGRGPTPPALPRSSACDSGRG
jgi:hypothetical protein